ncbi:saccharopine dehydrogenase family protein [Acinetobacter courvalinii]|uniref:saccharopine dehydrogenase family protein n=1 Tax=Acinetobacter courvalinii TaxID=280147 RepID=UPI0021D3CE36|nr:saccharopine dehydrogenase NADP-binding domain-containing protein [Acinetobacter courvalinii]MCU4366990.1 saccharopine dehydrogenase NADP-binding domain-containing protein [Acinetobacter courvalinii]MCU4445195.1 saccharopine dehydrogenase NADP-binding domain-containing protein [Acinetobacter courvalinii]
MTQSNYDLVVFGATSFVGQILTKYLAEYLSTQQEQLRWAIAGRSQQKLQELKNGLGRLGESLPILIADAGNRAELNALCAQTRVVVSTVGPYALYGEPLVQACVNNGTDYCDLTGETQWIKKMIEKYESQAQQSGARIVHCCGFDSVPSDMGVYYLQQQAQKQFHAPATQVSMRVKTLKGGASGGTVASLINVIQEAAADPALRKDLVNPYVLCPPDHGNSQRQIYIKTAKFDPDFNAWIAPFVMAAVNERVVHRSNALSGNAYGRNFSYNEAILTGEGLKGRFKALGVVSGLGVFMLAAVTKPVSQLMERYMLPKPGEGPTPEQQLAGRFDLRFIGKTEGGQKLRIKVTGDRDPGYGSTGKMLGQAALSLALDHYKERQKTGRSGGFWTPATMFDDRFIQRLTEHAGLAFEQI